MSPDGSSDSDSKPAKEIKHSKRPPPPPVNPFHKIISSRSENSLLNNPESRELGDLENENNNILGLVPCSVCGKQIGKNSIKFHLKQCEKKQQLMKQRQKVEDEKLSVPVEDQSEGKSC